MNINIKVILSAILLFSYLEPEYFTTIPLLHISFNIVRLMGLFLGLFLLLKYKQMLYVTLAITLFYFVYGVSTILHEGDIVGLISDSSRIIGFILWAEHLLRHYPIKSLQIMNLVFSSMTYLNILFFLLFPDGYISYTSSTDFIVNRYFLGVYNQFANYLIPAIIISIIYSLVKHNKIILSTKILILSVLFTFIYFMSATSIVGISLIIAYLLIIHKGLLRYFINYKLMSISFITIFILIVFLNNMSIFSFFIEDILNKDLTLSSRTLIWDKAIEMISESPYLGYGYLEDGRYIQLRTSVQRSAHNTFLQFFLQAGALGFIMFMPLFIVLFKRLSVNSTNHIVRFIVFSLFASFIMMLAEVYSLVFFVLVILLAIYTPNIVNQTQCQRKKIRNQNNSI